MIKIKAEVEHRYRLTLGGGDAELVLYDATKETIAKGLTVWTGKHDQEGVAREGEMVTLGPGAGFFDALVGSLWSVDSETVLAASPHICEILGQRVASEKAASETGDPAWEIPDDVAVWDILRRLVADFGFDEVEELLKRIKAEQVVKQANEG